MPIKSIIAAIDENNAIGSNNQLLCHLPNDLKHFKTITQGHTIIMGRKTFESLPKGALPNRRNIVISRNKDFHPENVDVFSSISKALDTCKSEKEVFIIGGGSIYEQFFNFADRLYITYIHHRFENADTFFPQINNTQWKETLREEQPADDKNKFKHTFVTFVRIS